MSLLLQMGTGSLNTDALYGIIITLTPLFYYS